MVYSFQRGVTGHTLANLEQGPQSRRRQEFGNRPLGRATFWQCLFKEFRRCCQFVSNSNCTLRVHGTIKVPLVGLECYLGVGNGRATSMKAKTSRMAAILDIDWKGTRKAMRASANAMLLAAAVLPVPRTLPAQHTPPPAREVEVFAERVRSERYMGTEARVSDQLFHELTAGVPADYPSCHSGDRNIWRLIRSRSGPTGRAVWRSRAKVGASAARLEIANSGYTSSRMGNIEQSLKQDLSKCLGF